jgi:methylphosphotriester-DNA--protein-cysteine methyltransferase
VFFLSIPQEVLFTICGLGFLQGFFLSLLICVEEAKKLMVNPRNANFTILSIGFEAGFNSKSTFNTVLKKFTGLTPTEFRQQQRLDAALA